MHTFKKLKLRAVRAHCSRSIVEPIYKDIEGMPAFIGRKDNQILRTQKTVCMKDRLLKNPSHHVLLRALKLNKNFKFSPRDGSIESGILSAQARSLRIKTTR